MTTLTSETTRRGEYAVPEHADIQSCRSCGASIVWTRTATGKPMPLSVLTIEERNGAKYALSHFADCPEGREWRR
jgi:hypothetical protein